MPRTKALILSLSIFLVTTMPAFAAPKEVALYSFCAQQKCSDGERPVSSLISDTAGNLYGTTPYGGHGGGVVFELTPGGDGSWSEKILYSFCPALPCKDGLEPGGNLIFDKAGSLYGVTRVGGNRNGYCSLGCGTVFQLKPNANGSWTEKVLYRFGHPAPDDGIYPMGSLAFDNFGNIYGTTNQGGTAAGVAGTVFELSLTKGGGWFEKVLQSFSTLGSGGEFPAAGLTISASGRLYGTSPYGGAGNSGCGTVFELTPGKQGKWTTRVIHSFNGRDGCWPFSVPAVDAAGNLYVTTSSGGAGGRDNVCRITRCVNVQQHHLHIPGDPDYIGGNGTVVELMPARRGKWTEKVLRSFYQAAAPLGGVVLDATGNLYGTTSYGGRFSSGTAFELSFQANGKWAQTRLHSFGGSGDGSNPASSVIFDAAGNLYGTTEFGGTNGSGTIFEITP